MSMNPTPLSKKRRRGDDTRATKFYAVRTGARPGVYRTWEECQEQTNGFKGANYKAFTTQKDAQDFVAGNEVRTRTDSAQPERFYGVAVGRCPGVYTDWALASLQITNVKRPIYRKFHTRAEAEHFVKTKGNELGKVTDMVNSGKKKREEAADEEEKEEEDEEEEDISERPNRKRNKNSAASYSRNMDLDVKTIKVYTDGSARKYSCGARAGVGVFFGTNDPRNVSEPLRGEPQTNQRAELTAVLRALQICPEDKNVQIFSDSTYAINCSTNWYRRWLKNKWRTSNGSPVVNQDIIKNVRILMDRRGALGALTDFTWVRGHSNDPGNEAADRLAMAGTNSAR